MTPWQPTDVERALLRHVINENGDTHQEIKAAEEYAEAHIKPIENSIALNKLRGALEATVSAEVGKYATSGSYNNLRLKDPVVELIKKEVSACLGTQIADVVQEERKRMNEFRDEIRNKMKSLEEYVALEMSRLLGEQDAADFIIKSFRSTLNDTLKKFIGNKPLAEIESMAEEREKKSRHKNSVGK